MSFKEDIQKWVQLDNEISILSERVRKLKETKASISRSILDSVEDRDLHNATIKISDGSLKFTKTKISEPLTFKYLENKLSNVIPDKEKLSHIIEYLKASRNTKISHDIKRVIKKDK